MTGVTFTINGTSQTTPYTEWLSVGSYTIEMPETHTVGEAKYYWNQWSDGNISRSRTVTMDTQITLTAHYTGPYYQLTVTSSPTTGIPFTINGVPQTTPYTEWLLESSYTLEMPETHDGYMWSHWLEDGDIDRTKTVTVDTQITLTAVYVPPLEALEELVETIESWNLSIGIENSLTRKLDDVIHLLDKGNENGAIHKLMDFIDQVEAQREKKLTDEQADYLLSKAQTITDLING